MFVFMKFFPKDVKPADIDLIYKRKDKHHSKRFTLPDGTTESMEHSGRANRHDVHENRERVYS